MTFTWKHSPVFEPHLNKVRYIMNNALKLPQGRIGDQLAKLLSNTGKLLRPTLTLLSSMIARELHELSTNTTLSVASTPLPDSSYHAAAAIELLHLATLVHDDIIDQAQTRRGMATLAFNEGPRFAVLAGDILFTSALSIISPWASNDYINQAVSALQNMCYSEILQHDLQNPLHPNERLYKRQIFGKTALLFTLCTRAGVDLHPDASKLQQQFNISEVLGRFAYGAGMAFQIQDDILDIHATGNKSACRDIAQGLLTLPVLKALQHHGKEQPKLQRLCLLQIARQKKRGLFNWNRKELGWQQARRFSKLIQACNGIDLAQVEISEYLAYANKTLEHLPVVPSCNLAHDFAAALLNRQS